MYYNYTPPLSLHSSDTIKVTGQGSVTLSPDRALITLGVSTESTSLQDAQSENATVMNRVINSISNQNIPRNNIQTKDFRIHPQYDYIEGKQVFRGYRVTNMIEVTVDDITQVGQIVDLAVNEGANEVQNIQFTVANSDLHYENALKISVNNARDKARTIAEELGVSVSSVPRKIKEITTRTNQQPQPYVLGVSTESATTPIEPGQLEIKAVINATFDFN
ncbi:SIMPL domain-containing protein [Ornithinibacillus halophilus]|uniref:26 kDa periplasmic immunogenic protein n=1 Tax=Ornithinibacillus halophilus TaxID=930117 RepID=A0A1M5GDN0_9BACI|nr:SIMPL domain-containing protein [Ornithinibacillus halophilus]SHG01789.1 hypothetical protein SAMN05216225_101263 [Ornithinibacillus halophilus]